MKTIEVQLHTFSELSERSKERARSWWRAGPNAFDDQATLVDIYTCAYVLGISLAERPNSRPSLIVRSPAFYYSGFSSQGDGASFTGTYRYLSGALRDVQAYAPKDERLSAIAKRLQVVQRRNFYRLTAAVTQRGRYVHDQSMEILVSLSGDENNQPSAADAEEIQDCLRDFARWAYRQLEEDYNVQMSNAHVDDLLEANGYEFLAYGELWVDPALAAGIAP